MNFLSLSDAQFHECWLSCVCVILLAPALATRSACLPFRVWPSPADPWEGKCQLAAGEAFCCAASFRVSWALRGRVRALSVRGPQGLVSCVALAVWDLQIVPCCWICHNSQPSQQCRSARSSGPPRRKSRRPSVPTSSIPTTDVRSPGLLLLANVESTGQLKDCQLAA